MFKNKTESTKFSDSQPKHGFTLSEVLITLGIIGVVAAMTIPNLMTSIQEKQTVSKLRATQSILSQALKSAEEEIGTPADWELALDRSESDAKIIAKKLKPYLKIAIDCGTNDSKSMCAPNVRYKRLNGTESGNHATNHDVYKIVLNNGTSLWFRSGDSTEAYIMLFYVDINGKQGPNTWGKDMFSFYYFPLAGLTPGGGGGTTSDCTINGSGGGCAYYVLQTGSMSYLHKK